MSAFSRKGAGLLQRPTFAVLAVEKIVCLGKVGHLHIRAIPVQPGHRLGTAGATPLVRGGPLVDAQGDVAEQDDLRH